MRAVVISTQITRMAENKRRRRISLLGFDKGGAPVEEEKVRRASRGGVDRRRR